MYLYLDTTERDSFQIALVDKGQVLKHKTILSVRQHSEKLLKAINSLLKSSSMSAPAFTRGARVRLARRSLGGGGGWLRGIAVVRGPGSFTSLRVGISTANALAFAWGVPARGVAIGFDLQKLDLIFKKKQKNIVLPEYGSAPHITLAKQ